jgi:hypothetical protein
LPYLQVPVSFFFEEMLEVPAAAISIDRQSSPDRLTDFMATREGLTLAKAFMQISNVQLRRRIVDLVEHGASIFGTGRDTVPPINSLGSED